MKFYGSFPRALMISVSLAFIAGCGESQPSIGAPGVAIRATQRQSATFGYTGARQELFVPLCYKTGTNVYGYNPGTIIPAGPTVPVLPPGIPAGTIYQVVGSGYSVVIGQLQTNTFAALLDDTWSPSDRFVFDLGLRWDSYGYALGDDTTQGVVGGSNAPYYSEFNLEHCYDSAAATPTVFPGVAHTYSSPDTTNTIAHTVLEPQASGTSTLSSNSGVRFSAGTYSQPTRAVHIQYLPTTDIAAYTVQHFLQHGFTTSLLHDPVVRAAYLGEL